MAKSLLDKRLNRYPKGKIHISKCKNGMQYYVRASAKDKTGEYISKKHNDKIKLFLQKRYDEEAIKLINFEITSLEKLLKKTSDISPKIRSLYSEQSHEIQEFLLPLDMSDDDYAIEWINTPYQKKKVDCNVPIFITNRGEQVRSKSELIIANRLYELKIPYKYECQLILSSGRVIYPDFTTLDVYNRREIYWEHRGMIDNQDYANHAVQRIRNYNSNGIFLGKNLIITEETSTNPLDTSEIDCVIKHYFAAVHR